MKHTILPDGETQEEVTPREARQGPRGSPVLYVLIAGLLLVGIVFGAMYLFQRVGDVEPADPIKGASIELMHEAL